MCIHTHTHTKSKAFPHISVVLLSMFWVLGKLGGEQSLVPLTPLYLTGFCTAIDHPLPPGLSAPQPCFSASPASSSVPHRLLPRTPTAPKPSSPRRMKWMAGSSLTCPVSLPGLTPEPAKFALGHVVQPLSRELLGGWGVPKANWG